MEKRLIQCHDCGKEIIILDKYEEVSPEDLNYCPLCGSENIERE